MEIKRGEAGEGYIAYRSFSAQGHGFANIAPFFVINMKTNVVVGASLPHKLLHSRGMYVPYKFGYFLLEPRAYGCAFKVNEVEPSIPEISKINPKPCCSGYFCCCG